VEDAKRKSNENAITRIMMVVAVSCKKGNDQRKSDEDCSLQRDFECAAEKRQCKKCVIHG
jgi:hypothetical protein